MLHSFATTDEGITNAIVRKFLTETVTQVNDAYWVGHCISNARFGTTLGWLQVTKPASIRGTLINYGGAAQPSPTTLILPGR